MKLIYASLFTLAACATAIPSTPAQTVYAAQNSYAAALTVAVAYKSLPKCEAPAAPPLCSKATVVAQLQKADDVAYPALQAAQVVVRTPGAGANVQTAVLAAQQAIAVLTAITSTLVVR